jgi:hypothetical protein
MISRPPEGRPSRTTLLAMMVALSVLGPAAPARGGSPVAVQTWDGASTGIATPTPRDPDRSRYARYEEVELQRARRAVAAMQRADPSLKVLFEESVGYAVFAQIGGREGSGGTGVLYEDGRVAGRAVIPAWPTGPRSGHRPYAAVIFFASRHAVATFKHGGLDMAAQAHSVAVVAGRTATVRFVSGVSVFTLGGDGDVTARAAVVEFGYLPYVREDARTAP